MPKFIPVENVNLNEVINLTEEQAKGRYNIGRTNLKEIANIAAANVRIGAKRLYSRPILDEYFTKTAE